jgi:transcriptional regulator with XRE-family HTH domain
MPLINQNIKVLRKQMGLTQEKFAEMLGVKRSLIGAYEESRAIPPADNLSKLANLFGVSLDQLLNYSFEREINKNPNLDLVQHLKDERVKDLFQQQAPPNMLTKHRFAEEPSSQLRGEPDLFSNFSNFQNTNRIEDNTLRYIHKKLFVEYLQHAKKTSFFENLPVLNLPFLPKGYLRAFDAPADFLIADSILIVEQVENFDLLKDGENHLLISKSGDFSYCRIYNQLKIKGTLLLSSDKAGISSAEIRQSDVFEIWFVKAFFSKVMPKPNVMLSGVEEKMEALKNEIDSLIAHQASL